MVNGIFSLTSLYDLSLLVHRNARDFCVLTLYPATLLNSLMSSSSLIASLEFSMYNIMSPTMLVWIIFQFEFLLFLSLLWLPWWGLSNLYWINVVRVDIFVLLLILEEMFSAFHHWEWWCSVAESEQPSGLLHTRFLCLALCGSHTCPLSWWCCLTISSSAAHFFGFNL